MRAPAFWQAPEPSPLACLLKPLAAAYGFFAARRMNHIGVEPGIPVICVGNFTAGGAGKTPVALALADLLHRHSRQVFFISRGYGGTVGRGPLRVDPRCHNARLVGDEPLLLAACAPTIVGSDRVAAAHFARQQGAGLIIMDDGLQNPALRKDLAFAVIDGRVGLGNGLCLPAGPLRAPLAAQAGHVDQLIVIGGTPGSWVKSSLFVQKPIHLARLVSDETVCADWRGKKALAFAAIGRPEKFFDSLRQEGVDLVDTQAFADHHYYSSTELSSMARQAAEQGAHLLTTEKDFLRIPPKLRPQDLSFWPIRLVFDQEEKIAAGLLQALERDDIKWNHLMSESPDGSET